MISIPIPTPAANRGGPVDCIGGPVDLERPEAPQEMERPEAPQE